MRLPSKLIDSDRAFLLDPVRLVRWVYVGRVSLATAIFLAALFAWQDPDTEKQKVLVATLVFAATVAATALSALFSEFYRRPLRSNFFYLQAVFDLLLVTAVAHVTAANGAPSQFAALYILVIATSSLLLPIGGGLLVALLGNVLYFADAILSVGSPFTAGVWLQLGVFAIVALGSAYLSAKLKELGAGTEAELAHVRLQAADILYNIRSGIVTIDAPGRLVYANPMAEQLLGADLEALIGKPVLVQLYGIAPELAEALERSVTERVRTTRGEGTIARSASGSRSASPPPTPTATACAPTAPRRRSSRTSRTRSGWKRSGCAPSGWRAWPSCRRRSRTRSATRWRPSAARSSSSPALRSPGRTSRRSRGS